MNKRLSIILISLATLACSFNSQLPAKVTASAPVITHGLHSNGYHSKIAPKAHHAELLKMKHKWQVMNDSWQVMNDSLRQVRPRRDDP